MDNTQITSDYLQAVKAIKQAILESRYRAARLVNKEVLALYYAIGGYISVRSRSAKWGTNAIGVISAGYYWWKKDLDKQCYLDEAVRYISVSETIINKRAQLIIQKIKEKL